MTMRSGERKRALDPAIPRFSGSKTNSPNSLRRFRFPATRSGALLANRRKRQLRRTPVTTMLETAPRARFPIFLIAIDF